MSGHHIIDILEQKQFQHGDFKDVAAVTKGFHSVIAGSPNYKQTMLSNRQVLALEMISHKMARVLCGDPDYVDHWVDIAGYATLISKSICVGDNRPKT